MTKKNWILATVFLLLDAVMAFITAMSSHLMWAVLLAAALWMTLVSFLNIIKDVIKKKNPKTMIVRLAAGVIIAIEMMALAFGAFYFVQDAVLFHPSHDSKSLESLVARSDVSAMEITSEGKTWHGVLRSPESGSPSPLIIFFCGNGENAAQAMRQMDTFGIWRYFNDYQCLIMDYAGYGLNDGRPSAKNMYEEALAIFDHASALPQVSRVIVGGFSIGTGPAMYLATHRDVDGLFLLAPFANTYDLYNNALPIFYGPLRLLVKHRFSSDEYAKTVCLPSLVVASRDDKTIPFASSEKVSQCLGENNTLVTLSGIDHNGILFNQRALEGVSVYLNRLAFE